MHYTPPELAAFLAEVTAAALERGDGELRILDPACGDGGLLAAIARALPAFNRLVLTGFETDAAALAQAQKALAPLALAQVRLHHRDFLLDRREHPRYDVIIANPPYVRTQVLGARKAQRLARRFNLTGRVDLYHAFVMAMAAALKPGGVLGLLTSNRFLTIRSGAAQRRMLSAHFELLALYDLGDTRLFSAAVLPAILVARKGGAAPHARTKFHRAYEYRGEPAAVCERHPSILAALQDPDLQGIVATRGGIFRIERGSLAATPDGWALSTDASRRWLELASRHQAATFGDLAKVRVGIKSTADEVFVRADWPCLPPAQRPEAELLHPLLTHREAARWVPKIPARSLLYPHTVEQGRRRAIELSHYPRARAYLLGHRSRLLRRSYLTAAGRRWYELWVPHHPADWARPKLAWPDIAEQPRFFFDGSGALVQGDCYWLTLRDGVEADWLMLMLAVANSTFIARFYDASFHNKLYAGRRRFMTQYVARFPLPELAKCKALVEEVRAVVSAGRATAAQEHSIDRLVWKSFGLRVEKDSATALAQLEVL